MHAGSRIKIDKMDPEEMKNPIFDYSTTHAKSEVWKKMSNIITAKKTEEQSISDLFLSKVMKDKIFTDILDKFAKG